MPLAKVRTAWTRSKWLLNTSDNSQHFVFDIIPTLPSLMEKMFSTTHACVLDRNIDLSQNSKEYISLIGICMRDVVCTVCVGSHNKAGGCFNLSLTRFVCVFVTFRRAYWYAICELVPVLITLSVCGSVLAQARAWDRVRRFWANCLWILFFLQCSQWWHCWSRIVTKQYLAFCRYASCGGMQLCHEY